MNVTCRREDQGQFEELGFCLAFEQDPNRAIVEMEIDEANYAFSGLMPTEIPYYGYHSSGGSYGPHEFVCDGKELLEVETGHGKGYCICVIIKDGKAMVHPEDLEAVQSFIEMQTRIMQQLAALKAAETEAA